MVAIDMYSMDREELFLIRRAGYSGEVIHPAVLFGHAQGGKFEYNPVAWGDRTFQTAHQYICENFNALGSGDVIDVEFVLGETKEPKKSERLG